MPIELFVALVVAALAAFAAAWLTWRRLHSNTQNVPAGLKAIADRPAFRAAGLLVSEEVLKASGSSSPAIWEALEGAATPVAIEYFPVSQTELTKLKTVPVNASVHQAMVEMIRAIDPKSPTLFRVALPKGAALVKAVGTAGFRGFSRTGGKTAHAVLTPVAAGGAIAAGWPVLVVAGSVFVVDMVAQRELRAHQRRVEALLGRQEERYHIERVANQRTADAQLTRAISLLLDGHGVNLEVALKSAWDEFHRSQLSLEKYRGAIEPLLDDDGRVDYRRLEEALGGKEKNVDAYFNELRLASTANAIQRKAILADAAARALADPTNPYAALRKHFESQVQQLETAEAVVHELTERVATIELTGRWHEEIMGRLPISKKSVSARQGQLRAQVTRPEASDAEISYLVTPSGDVLQVLPSEQEEETDSEKET
jgi:hypothetical protein